MQENFKHKGKESILDVVITKEKIDDKEFFVAQGVQLDVASQGLTLEEAIENIKDAAEIVLEDSKEKRLIMIEQESSEIAPMLTRVFV
jgi:predicted RNase H-like HicB family nuclease